MLTSLRGLLTGAIVTGLVLSALPAATASAGPVHMAAAKRKVFLPKQRGHFFKVPAGVATMTFDMVGGGAGGGSGTWTSSYDGGNGGGAGAVLRCRVPVQPQSTMLIFVGGGGVGGSSSKAYDPMTGVRGGDASASYATVSGGGGAGSGPLAFRVSVSQGVAGDSGYRNSPQSTGKGGTTFRCESRGTAVQPISFTAGGDGQNANDVYGGAGGKTGTLPAGCPKDSGAGGKGGHSAKNSELAKGHRGGNGCIVLSW